MAVYLGIDAGTTRVKAALVDGSGQILHMAGGDTQVLRPFEGACEMDMDLLWVQLCGLLKTLKTSDPDAWGQIAGVGISAQGDGLWTLDKGGRPVRNAILWNDTRTRELDFDPETDETLNRLLIENASTALFAGAFSLILKWMKEREPDYYARIDKVARCKDWLGYKLTGRLVSDYTDFSACGINIFTKDYVPALLDYLGIEEAKGMLPPLIPSTGFTGAVSAEAEAACGIAAGTPVIAGAIDVMATVLGTGMRHVGDGCTILGTTLCNEMIIGAEQVDMEDRNGSVLCGILPDQYVRVMAANSGSAVIDWAKGILAPELSFDALAEQLKQIPVGCHGLLYHPYICGERAPFRNPFACGGFYGLTVRHGRFEMMRAAYEGMALSVKDCYRALPKSDGKIYLSGGGAASDFTCQMIADALGREVRRQDRKELAIMGIVEAIKIATGNAEGQSEEIACDIFRPDLDNSRRYEALYAEFSRLKDNMTGFWQRRQLLMGRQDEPTSH